MDKFHIETERLTIRNWCHKDRGLMHLINSDERVMEFFPFRRNRAQSDETLERIRASIDEKGYGFTAIAMKQSDLAIGFCGLADVNFEAPGLTDRVEIGWRLAPEYWGNGYITEAALSLLRFGFEHLNLKEIVSFAVQDNHRSIAVMERIGMTPDPGRDFDHPRVPETHPHLKRHLVYSINALADPQSKARV